MKFFVTGVGDQLGHDVMNELSRGFRKNSLIHHSYVAPAFEREIEISPRFLHALVVKLGGKSIVFD